MKRGPRILCLFVCFLGHALPAAEPAPVSPIFGNQNYVEYIPGNLPIILTAPHGGREAPAHLPDRVKGVVQSDANTQELARAISDELRNRTGKQVHLVICRLHRRKVDMNREIVEAAQGSPGAEESWGEYHGFIEQACRASVRESGSGFLIDLHGQSHKDQRVELGYLHSPAELAQPEAALNAPDFAAAGSFRLLAARSKLTYAELLRGPQSLGGLLQAQGFRCTPSPAMPVPTEPYFRGGYTVQRHATAKKMTGLQVEANRVGLRDTPENRQAFARGFVSALEGFLPAQMGFTLHAPAAPIPPRPKQSPDTAR